MLNPLKLANEWRDTLLITVSIPAFATFSPTPVIAIDGLLTVATFRLAFRVAAWELMPPPQIIGGARAPDPSKVVAAALAVFWPIVWVQDAAGFITPSPPARAFYAICTILAAIRVAADHGNSLSSLGLALVAPWDWPRKRDGGGETQKLTSAISNLIRRPLAAGGTA